MTPPVLFFVLALVLFAVEIFVLQFAVIWVAVFGLGAFIAAIAGYLFPGLDWSGVIAVFVGASCLLYTSPSPRDKRQSRMPSSA